MSGIGNSIDVYQGQLNQLNSDFTKIEAELKKLENDNQNVVTAYKNAQAKAQETVDWYNQQGFKDMHGNTLKFDTMQQWFDKCDAGGVCDKEGKPINNGLSFYYPVTVANLQELKTAEDAYKRVMGPTLDKLNEAKEKLDKIGTGLKDSIGSLQAMNKLLQSGDIEGSVMLLQTTRAKGLDQQLGGRIGALQSRNAQIKSLSDTMAYKQTHQFDKVDGKDPSDTEKANRTGAISTLKNQIDQLNSDSQLDMIGIQGLVNKRNEAFDMLTNLLGKFQKTIDGIVGNMR